MKKNNKNVKLSKKEVFSSCDKLIQKKCYSPIPNREFDTSHIKPPKGGTGSSGK